MEHGTKYPLHTKYPYPIATVTPQSSSWMKSLKLSHCKVVMHLCLYIYIWQLSSFRVPTLWFIDLTDATCHIQNTFLSLCEFFFAWENWWNTRILSLPFSYDMKVAANSYVGAQSINSERASLNVIPAENHFASWNNLSEHCLSLSLGVINQ